MKFRLSGICALLCMAFAGHAWSADFDGSKLLICATVEVHDCAADLKCKAGTPNAMGAPGFLRVDVEKKQIVGPKRVTPIQLIERSDEQLLLLGTELGMGWTMALDRETGAMSLSLASRDGTFVLFGTCTPL